MSDWDNTAHQIFNVSVTKAKSVRSTFFGFTTYRNVSAGCTRPSANKLVVVLTKLNGTIKLIWNLPASDLS